MSHTSLTDRGHTSTRTTAATTAKDSEISEACLNRWLTLDEVETRDRPGVTIAEASETGELKKRNRILEEENLILRRAAAFFATEMLAKWVPARLTPIEFELVFNTLATAA